eukprot:1198507-Rhodomonas_salina.1
MLMHCEVTKQARLRAHDSIADTLVHSIAETAPGDWVAWTRPVAWKIAKLLGDPPHLPRTRFGSAKAGKGALL